MKTYYQAIVEVGKTGRAKAKLGRTMQTDEFPEPSPVFRTDSGYAFEAWFPCQIDAEEFVRQTNERGEVTKDGS